MNRLVLTILFVASLAVAADVITICSGPDAAFRVDYITISPDRIVKKANVTISAQGELLRPIEAGTMAKLELSLDRIPIIKTTIDVCQQLEETPDAPFRCPLPAGPLSIPLTTAPLPEELLAGHYRGSLKASLPDGQELVCAKLDLWVYSK
ncbi:hypothetical protein RCL1_001779 [Eukaryota sp. TZLM3-RCL]